MGDSGAAEDFAEFIRKVRKGDEQAAESIIKLYEAEIRLEIRTWLRLRDPRLRRVFDSMDICQSVLASFFVRAAVGDFELEEPSQLIRLLVGMAKTRLAEHVRFHQRQRRDVRRTGESPPEDGPIPSDDESPSQMASRRELLQKFRELFSDEERRLAEMRAQGFDWTSVANELGGTPDGRRKQLSRAVSRVGKELGLDWAIDP